MLRQQGTQSYFRNQHVSNQGLICPYKCADVTEDRESFANGELARYTSVDAMEVRKANCYTDACGSLQTLC